MNNQVEPRPQRQMKSQEFPISYLLNQRTIFNNYPDYQREQVWKLGRKQLLINAILSGLPVPPLIARKLIHKGETIYELIDGQQRFKTICDFRDGKFETATLTQMRKLEPLWTPIEPGKSYTGLSAEARHMFNDFNILLYSSDDIDLAVGSQIYRNLQRGQALTSGQRLKSYYSKINLSARELSNHSFWREIYVGQADGEERLRGSLHALIMEMGKGYSSQKPNNLRDYACGLKDDLLTEDAIVACSVRLDIASHLFSKSKIHQPYEVISLYQAVLLLQKEGYNLDHLERGCFTNWFDEVQRKAYRARYQGGGSTLASLVNAEEQRYFWKEHLPKLKSIANQSNGITV